MRGEVLGVKCEVEGYLGVNGAARHEGNELRDLLYAFW